MTDKVNSTSTQKKNPPKTKPIKMSAIHNMFSGCLHCFKLYYFEYLEILNNSKL